MLTVYFTSDSEVIKWGEAPNVGDLVPGSDQAIAAIEFYRGELENVCFARVADRTVYEDETFHVEIAPDHSIIRYGWSMECKPPTGRLINYEPTSHETLMRPVASDWCVDMIDTCKPLETGTYKAIHICHCVRVSLPVAA